MLQIPPIVWSQIGNSIWTFVRNGVAYVFLGFHLSYADTLDTPLVFSEDGPLILGAKENLEDRFPLYLKRSLMATLPLQIVSFVVRWNG